MLNKKDFMDKYYPLASVARQDDASRFLDSLNTLVDSTPLKDALTDKQILCRAFYLQKGGNISRPHYQKIKEYLLNVFEYLGIKSTIPPREDVIAARDTICFFRSINSLLRFIDGVGAKKIDSYNPTTDLVRVKAACVLGWIGLSLSEIANLKRTDIALIGLDGYRITTPKGEFEIYGELFSTILYLVDLVEYKSLPVGNSRGRKIILKDTSDYLFRLPNENCSQLKDEVIINIIGRFNMGSDSDITIVFRNLRKNALFVEIYNDSSDKPLINKIMDTVGCSYNVALSHRDQYLRFAEAMDNNKI